MRCTMKTLPRSTARHSTRRSHWVWSRLMASNRGCTGSLNKIAERLEPVRKLWGGRFEGETDALIAQLNDSMSFDGRMWRQDIAGSIAHAAMLGTTGIVSQSESSEL